MQSRSDLEHIRTTITGMRNMLSCYFYCDSGICELVREDGIGFTISSECGGVMDHLANIIDALDELIDDPEPGDREPHFPAPGPTTTNNTCPHCGGSMLGDGCTTVMHCERIDITSATAEPDSAPIFCDPTNPND